MIMESKVQAKITSFLELDGWYVVKCMKMSKNGFPDLLAFKDGNTIGIEVKDKGKKPRPLQEYRLKELNQHGVKSFYADSLEMVKEKLNKQV